LSNRKVRISVVPETRKKKKSYIIKNKNIYGYCRATKRAKTLYIKGDKRRQ
jgi:hypothetical protein